MIDAAGQIRAERCYSHRLGCIGQITYVNPTKHIVIVEISAWPKPEDDQHWEEAEGVK